MTFLSPLLFVGIGVFVSYLSSLKADLKQIAVHDETGLFVSEFKKAIYPGSGSLAITGNAAQLLFFPYEFVVSFYAQGIQGGSKLIFSTASCACTDLTVQYTPNGGYNTHIDGYPTALSISATFQEMYILSRNDIEKLGTTY